MKQILISILAIASVVGLTALLFTYNQAVREKARMTEDLQYRSTLLAESLRETIEPNFNTESSSNLQYIVEKFSNRERLVGIVVFDNVGSVIAGKSDSTPEEKVLQEVSASAMDGGTAYGEFAAVSNKRIYLLAVPLYNQNRIVGSLMVIQNASYVDIRLADIWRTNFIRLSLQISLVTISILIFVRWLIFKPVQHLSEILKSARTGNDRSPNSSLSAGLFQPLTKEILSMRRSLKEALLSAKEEAQMSLNIMDSPWTSQRLQEFVKNIVKDRTIVIVSNREPYIHTKVKGKISHYFPASGMATALEPIMQACGGTWVAHGSGDADALVVDEHDRVQVPPDDPKYTLRRVWLNQEEEDGYYNGFSNEGLWALSHNAHNRPIFRKEDWETYKKVNGQFAEAVLDEIKSLHKPIVFIQDFHFSLLPQMIKKSRPDATVVIFWHVPWVSAESFSICPWKKEILEGMLGADIVGFHTQLHCNNFIETVGRELESLIDFEQFSVTRDQHTSFIKPFPISIAFSNRFNDSELSEEEKQNQQALLEKNNINSRYIGLGVDRLDYTKGILERLKAIEILLSENPTYIGKFTFIQISAPSREKIKKYQELAVDVKNEIERINDLYKTRNWKPVVWIKKHHSHHEIEKYYKLANVCLVTSLHDGMNLVAKEFVAARDDQKGVLVLSQFTGASRELKESLIINPYNAEQTAQAIKAALEMPLSEQKKRMSKLRATVRNYNVYRWSAEFIKTMTMLG